jgi:hypothetical protein
VQTNDPDYTRRKVREFLATHTVYELIPESGKVVLLDCALPIRQAFHALHEQASHPGAPCGYAQQTSMAQVQALDQPCTAGLVACWSHRCAVLDKDVGTVPAVCPLP